ncbi:MAG TPA: hypothetical protein VFV61_09750 [Pyrinomonadaceae bacterium]|nr:hypothetical protein [Pyrinomonadaceae bacterium]
MLTIEFSRRLAYIGGVITPLAETIRRWSTWQQTPANFFDDYLLGALLIYGAWRTGRNVHDGQRFLIAAWAVACGLGYYSFFGQLQSWSRNEADPAPISSLWIAVIKGIAWAIAILALIVSLQRLPNTDAEVDN